MCLCNFGGRNPILGRAVKFIGTTGGAPCRWRQVWRRWWWWWSELGMNYTERELELQQQPFSIECRSGAPHFPVLSPCFSVSREMQCAEGYVVGWNGMGFGRQSHWIELFRNGRRLNTNGKLWLYLLFEPNTCNHC